MKTRRNKTWKLWRENKSISKLKTGKHYWINSIYLLRSEFCFAIVGLLQLEKQAYIILACFKCLPRISSAKCYTKQLRSKSEVELHALGLIWLAYRWSRESWMSLLTRAIKIAGVAKMVQLLLISQRKKIKRARHTSWKNSDFGTFWRS